MKKPNKSPLGIIKIALLIPAVLLTLGLTTGMTPKQKTITGQVIFADTGKPATGASVVVRGGTLGCVVDREGTFMLNVDGDPELVISFVGYSSLVVKASDIGKKPLELQVKTYEMDLESVPLEESGEISGSLWFKAKDGSDADPVFVLDGTVVTEIDDLDPGNIESINVIKDPEDPMMKKYNAKDGVVLITTKKEEEIFYKVDEMPTFNGGDPAQEFRKYIAKNLRYPQSAAENGISGRVIVQFSVSEAGQVVDARVVRSVDPDLDKEALRLVNSSSRWSPGKNEGKPVKVMFTFPVNFVLQDTEKNETEQPVTMSLNKDSGTLTIRNTDGSESTPVYVLDGEVVGTMEGIDPESIAKIEVNKDPESDMAKKYNAKDGVVLITTKEGILHTPKESMELGKETVGNQTDEPVFYIVEDMPQFPGGLPALKSFIYSNLEYPENAKKQGIEGKVQVRFLVNEQGKVEKSEILRSTYQGFDAPALNVINEMPDWTPGMQRGKAVKVWFVVSIQFNDEKH